MLVRAPAGPLDGTVSQQSAAMQCNTAQQAHQGSKASMGPVGFVCAGILVSMSILYSSTPGNGSRSLEDLNQNIQGGLPMILGPAWATWQDPTSTKKSFYGVCKAALTEP